MRRALGARSRAVLLLVMALLPLGGAQAERTFAAVGRGRGLEATVVSSLLVDRDGVLWVGSREGLYRYDGYQATAFLPSTDGGEGISDVDVRSLYEADDGALWIATNTGGLNRRDRSSGRFTNYHHDSADPRTLSHESVYSIAEDAAGRLWVGTQSGLNRLDPDGRGFTRYVHDAGDDASLAQDWVAVLHRGRSGRLWVGTVGGGVDRWDEAQARFEHFDLARLGGGPAALDDVFALHEGDDGRLWAGTRAGLAVLDPVARRVWRIDLAGDPPGQPLVTALHADRDGRLWVATLAHGVLVVDPPSGHWARAHPGSIGAPGNLPAQPQLSIASTGTALFVGTWGAGVYRASLTEPQYRLLAPSPDGRGLRDKNVTAVLGGAGAGTPWVGSFGGGAQRVDVHAGTVASSGGSTQDALRQAGVVSLARMADGTYFAGATEGLYHYAPDGAQLGLERHVSGQTAGLGTGYVTALLPAGASDLWVGVGGSGLYLREPHSGRYRAFRHDPAVRDSLSDDYVTALAHGQPGHLWVGTRSGGLNHCRIEPWSCERYDGRHGGSRNIGHHHVTALFRDREHRLWVATDGGGLYRVALDAQGRVSGFERWGSERGLLNDGIMGIAQDDDGSLWLSTRHGLARLDPATGRVVNEVAESGLRVSHFNTGAASSDGEYVYFGSVAGLLSLRKGTALRQRPAAPVRVTAIELQADGASRLLPTAAVYQGFTSRHGEVVALEYAVLDYAETTHAYEYRMQATDRWVPLGTRRQLTFAGLAPGHYRFEVRGRDAFGQWSASPPLAFEVVPPLWMTTWFRALAVAAAVLLAFGLHRARVRGLRRRNLVLEELRRQREQALERAGHSQRELEEAYAGLRQLTERLESAKEEERTRISRELHDEFGQTLTAAKIHLQLLRQATADPASAQRLDESVGLLDGMIRQARDIARALRPPLLDEVGLVPALEYHLESLSGRSGVRIEFSATPGVAAVPPGLNTTVFRIVQEAVSNALRHAGASTIRVTLRDDADALQLSVEDDGQGFDPPQVRQRVKRGAHLGLLGMTERVRSAGGTITLDSSPGAGSRIAARIPYARPATDAGVLPWQPA